jgi:hypothetical protein
MNRRLEARVCKIAAPLRMKLFQYLHSGNQLSGGCLTFGVQEFLGSTDRQHRLHTFKRRPDITVTAGATTNNTSLITVTPSNSFSGTVTLGCAVTTSVTSPVSPATCSLSSTSVSISGTTAETSTLTATTTSTTTSGAYTITVTGAVERCFV